LDNLLPIINCILPCRLPTGRRFLRSTISD